MSNAVTNWQRTVFINHEIKEDFFLQKPSKAKMSTGILTITLTASTKMARRNVLHASLGRIPASSKIVATLPQMFGKTLELPASQRRRTVWAFGQPVDMPHLETI